MRPSPAKLLFPLSLLLTAVVSYQVGRASTSSAPPAGAATAASPLTQSGAPSAAPRRVSAPAHAEASAARHVRRSEPVPGASVGKPDSAAAEVAGAGAAGSSSARELVRALEAAAASDRADRQDVLDQLQSRLVSECVARPEALAFCLERFRATAGSEAGALLAVALGQVKDAEVESAALDLARSGRGEAERLAGLELLDRLDVENPATRAGVLEILRGDASLRVQSAAIYALHRGLPEPADTRRTVTVLAPLAASADPELRRRAVVALAEWAPDAASLEPVLLALADPSPDVRAGAAFALGRTRVPHPGLIDALATRVADPHEDSTVRDLAWQSLTRFPLDDRTWARVQEFRLQHEAAGEVGGSEEPHGE
ncbi:MAG: HEAT repeat domain-containing protein [Planctomycetes bacterium]|nr:HEAT repeat domain-containing protein [Planctomycetota bacterium]